MAGVANGGKKPVFYDQSNGEKIVRVESNWNAGSSSHKKRQRKDHKMHFSTHLRYAKS